MAQVKRPDISTIQEDPARSLLVMNRIKEAHGLRGLRDVVDGLEKGTPLRTIAKKLGVSHEKVRRWSDDLGARVSFWQAYPNVAEECPTG
jgi:hypothetical protein